MLRRLLIPVLLSLLTFAPAHAARDFLVDADWLAAEQANNPKVIILEVRYHPHRYFTVGHIPGAIQVQRFKDLGDNDGRSIMLFPSQEEFQATLRRWGVNDDSTLVIYDDSRSALAARLYYLLGLYGFDMARVRVLDGGALEWSGFNDLTKEPTQAPSPSNPPIPGYLCAGSRSMTTWSPAAIPAWCSWMPGPPRCTAVKLSATRYRVGISPAPSTSFPWTAPIR